MYLSQIVVLLPFFTTFGHLNVVKLYIQLEHELLLYIIYCLPPPWLLQCRSTVSLQLPRQNTFN